MANTSIAKYLIQGNPKKPQLTKRKSTWPQSSQSRPNSKTEHIHLLTIALKVALALEDENDLVHDAAHGLRGLLRLAGNLQPVQPDANADEGDDREQ